MEKYLTSRGIDIIMPQIRCLKRLLKQAVSVSMIILIALILSQNTFATNSNDRQNAKVTLRTSNTKLSEILEEIEEQTGYLFIYNAQIDVTKELSIDIKNKTLKDVLSSLFSGENIIYSIEGSHVVLSQKGNDAQNVNKQDNKISGKIIDADGAPLIGVTIVVKETRKSMSSDINGSFTIEALPGQTLVLSYVGYHTQEMIVGNTTTYSIAMIEDVQSIDDVVVVGFATQKKVNLTGAVTSVNMGDIESRPTSKLSQALQGEVPGLNLTVGSQGGALGTNLSVDIRGSGTIGDGSNSSPLILIDGVAGDMNAINPDDIESISVLKDAAASSIYGSRAAFGVVLITTKNGKQGKARVSYNNSFRWTSMMQLPQTMDSYTFAQYFNTASANVQQTPVFNDDTIERILAYQRGEITTQTVPHPSNGKYEFHQKANANMNWPKEHFKTGFAQNHSLNISGGNDKLNYYMSGGFLDQQGNLRYGDDTFQRLNVSMKVSSQVNKWLNLGLNSRIIRESLDNPTYQDDSGLYYHEISRLWPTMPYQDPNGHFMRHSKLIQLTEGGRRKRVNDTYYTQATAHLTPIKNWNIYGNFTLKTQHYEKHEHLAKIYEWTASNEPVPVAFNGSYGAGSSYVLNEYNKYEMSTGNIYTDYSQSLGKHNFKIMAGASMELYTSKSMMNKRDDVISDLTPTVGTSLGKEYTGDSKTHWATAGVFGRFNYDYDGKYLVEFNIRQDGSSRFIGDKRWRTFPSVSLGYNMARESFWEPISKYVGTLKPRFSWGTLGNQNTSNYFPFYLTQPISQQGGWLIDGSRPITSTAPLMVSELLTWETVSTFNAGLDIGAFNNRLNITGEWYQRTTKNMVGPPEEQSSVIGISTSSLPRFNNATLETTGWELSAKWNDRIGEFKYSVGLVLSDYLRKVKKYPNASNSLSTYYEGQVLGNIWGFESLGIAKTDEEMQNHLKNNDQSQLGSSWGAGDIMYKDLDGDGIVSLQGKNTVDDPGDRKIIGNSTPRYSFGINLSAEWKGFDARVFFQGVGKRDLWLSGNYFWGITGDLWQSIGYTEHADYYRPEGHEMGANVNSYFPKPYFTAAQAGKNQRAQTHYLQDGSYMRLKNLQIGYSLPRDMVSKINVSRIRVYFSGDNLFTWTSLFKTFDPEVTSGVLGNGKAYPLSRTFSFGLNVQF